MFKCDSKMLAGRLKVFLDILWFFGIVAFVGSIIAIPVFLNKITVLNMLFALLLCAVGCVLVIIYQLRKILKTVIAGSPFVLENVHSFRKISLSTLGLGVYSLLYNISERGLGVLTIIETSKNGIYSNIGVWIPFVLGIFSLIIAEIFKQAHDIYEDQKLTI